MRIAIIGGGITGLTTALGLHKVGFNDITVYEQAEELEAIGAGIWLQPNAVKVFDWLGIKKIAVEHGIELDRMEITNSQLMPFKAIKSKTVQDENGNKTIAIHRGILQKILYSEASKICEIKLGMQYVNHQTRENDLLIKFDKGTESSNLLLAADGINSAVRGNIIPDARRRSAAQLCWRGVTNIEIPDDFKNLGREAWGRGIRFGFSQISSNSVYWFAVTRKKDFANGDTDLVSFLSSTFKEFHPFVKELILHTTTIHQAELCDLRRLETWHKGNICLIGDAAHATTPNMGQGACQGIEDAYFLSNFLIENKFSVDFRNFEKRRRKKVDYIVNNSWRFGKMAHNPLGREVLKLIMKLTPEKVFKAQMNRIYQLKS